MALRGEKKMTRKIIIIMLLTTLVGCAGKKSSFFQRAGDRLEVSSCATCKGKPFYVNGRWIADDKAK